MGSGRQNTMINQVDAVVPSLNTLYSQRFKEVLDIKQPPKSQTRD